MVVISQLFTKLRTRGAQQNQPDQNIEFISSENKLYHQTGNGYLEFSITVRKNDTTNFPPEDPIRLVNNGYAFCSKEARLVLLMLVTLNIIYFAGKYLLL